MNKQLVWGVIGAGWLGQEVVDRLSRLGVACWATHRKTFDWVVNEFPSQPCEVLLLNTPPLTAISPEDYVRKIPVRSGQKIIFISSIAVYGSAVGEVSEKTPTQPETKNGLWLCEVEQLLLQKFPGQICIIRAGGLIGGARHPVFFLSNKNSANARINLIHRDDLIEIIFTIAALERIPSVVNAVAPNHPYKKEYYEGWAQKLNLAPPHISQEVEASKIVSSEVLPVIYPHWICPDLDSL